MEQLGQIQWEYSKPTRSDVVSATCRRYRKPRFAGMSVVDANQESGFEQVHRVSEFGGLNLVKTPFPGSSACGVQLPELGEREQQAERNKQNNQSHFGPVLWRQSPLASSIRKKLDSHE
jgi:hypothetical protein